MTIHDSLEELNSSLEDFYTYRSQAAMENVLLQAALILAMMRGLVTEEAKP